MRLILLHFFIMSVIFCGCVARQDSVGNPLASESTFTASELDRVGRLIQVITSSREQFIRSVSPERTNAFATNVAMAVHYDDWEPLRGKLQQIGRASNQPLEILLRRSGERTESVFRFDPVQKELVPIRNTPQANSINIKLNSDSTWLEIGSAEVGFFNFSVGNGGKIIYGGRTIFN